MASAVTLRLSGHPPGTYRTFLEGAALLHDLECGIFQVRRKNVITRIKLNKSDSKNLYNTAKPFSALVFSL